MPSPAVRRILLENSPLKWGVLPGVAGSYFSTQDSAANSIIGDIDIDGRVALADYTPTLIQDFAAKDQPGQFAYLFRYDTVGALQLFWSVDGAALKSAQSTVAVSASDGSQIYVRAYLDVDNGAGGYSVYFYTSPDGVAWTQLGATVTAAGVTSIFNSSASLLVGTGLTAGTYATGKYYRVRIYNGNRSNGTLAVDFNPASYRGANNWVSDTGEIWTITGRASVTAA